MAHSAASTVHLEPGARSPADSWLESLRYALLVRMPVPMSAVLPSPRGGGFGIFVYHCVSPAERVRARPIHHVTVEKFRSQMSGLRRRGFTPFALSDILHRLRRRESLPERGFVVTFDDGYACIHDHVLPVLRELEIPATVFLATAFLDSAQPFPFDDRRAAGADGVDSSNWRPLSTAQCQDVMRDGLVDFGSHTHTHRRFDVDVESFDRDVRVSCDILSKRFGIASPPFAFPYGRRSRGDFSDAMVARVRNLGLSCALSTENDVIRSEDDPFTWGRFAVRESDTARTLAAKLTGWYGVVRNLARRLPKRAERPVTA